jgi:hypothetical protein
MMTQATVKKVSQLKKMIAQLGPILPGSLSKQWNVCSTPGCRCKDKYNPQRHGPYYQLSYTIAGKSSTFFIRKEAVAEVRRRLKRYQRYKKLCQELVLASVHEARKHGFSGGQP